MANYDPIARQTAQNAAAAAAQALALAGLAQATMAAQQWAVVNSNTAAISGQRLSVDTSVQPVTITLPAGGGTVSLRDNAGTWGTNPVTVVGNGANFAINGSATFLLNEPGFQINFALVNGAWLYTLQFLNGAAA
jgi:hypothetical protein